MVTNAKNALYEVKKKLYNHYHITIKREWWVDYERKAIIQTTNNVRFYVLFRREFFNTYENITGEEGKGESINVADFEYTVYELDIEQFLYIYPNNQIYKIRAKEIKKNSTHYINNADGREQYIFSTKHLQKL